MAEAIFEKACPNCEGKISSLRLLKGLPCELCLPEEDNITLEDIVKKLSERGSLKKLKSIYDLRKSEWEFVNFFKEKVGSDPWSLQRTWARRLFLKRSFAIVAPPGIGKTTFGIIASLFLDGKSYLLFPTRLLVEQAENLLKKYNDGKKKILIAMDMKNDEREKLKNGDFDILVSTTMFLVKSYEDIPKPFDFVFVDDVDALLKQSRSVDRILGLLGIPKEAVDETLSFLYLSIKLLRRPSKESWQKIEEGRRKLEELKKLAKGVLIVSSATAKPKNVRVALFRELLDLEIGKSASFLRKVEDLVLRPKRMTLSGMIDETVNLVKKLGNRGLIFVSPDKGKESVSEVIKKFEIKGIKALSYEEADLEAFLKGEVDVLVGIASGRNPLTRGLDIPETRYAIFIGVPKMFINLKVETSSIALFNALTSLRKLLEDHPEVERRYLPFLRNILEKEEEKLTERSKKLLDEIRLFLSEKLANPEFLAQVASSPESPIRIIDGEIYLMIPDVTGYLQAAGRTSRLCSGGLLQGLSIVIVDDEKALHLLEKKARYFFEEFSFKTFDHDKVMEVLNKVDKERQELTKIDAIPKDLFKTALIIVESPNKARTLASFFGSPQRRRVHGIDVYEVNALKYTLLIAASKGHVADLVYELGLFGVEVKDGSFIPHYDTIKRCQTCGEQTVQEICPRCKVPAFDEKREIIEGLKELALEADVAFIATDPDTEGEKIAWDLACYIKPYSPDFKRAEFHEITKRAFLEAIDEPRDINEPLVEAQFIRRIADRWFGFSLSQLLQETFKQKWLSAGRVQTPVLGWIIEKEKERKEKEYILRISADPNIRVEFPLAKKEDIKGSKPRHLHLKLISLSEEEISPLPPFDTANMLKEASTRYGWSAEETMTLAQELFERGLITYHRTDSFRISGKGISIAKEYILEKLGENLFQGRTWGDGGAHEGIRPTHPWDKGELLSYIYTTGKPPLSSKAVSLYTLIFRRFIASQMKNARVLRGKVLLSLDHMEKEESLTLKILEPGFSTLTPLSIFPLGKELLEKGSLSLDIKESKVITLPKAYPFTQGSLIEMMQKSGLGRPSTYATIIETLLERHYVVQKNGFLFPTKLGIEVYRHLREQYPQYTDEDFTRKIEEEMSLVERGEREYQKVLMKLYEETKEILNSLEEKTL
ncbi:MAG: reverse gyrase [Synergistetes bacterium]|nr:reverse gyrase [Synergistota bacterium]MCX8128313.1 reverse gyrase [Synergistota bacterium]MDW8192632.1 reverse gyrase [Synergistota bacterium]